MRLVLAAVLAVLAIPVQAQQPSPTTGTTTGTTAAPSPATPPARAHRPRLTLQQRFDAANTSHDGKLTLDQAKAGKMNRIVTNYDAIDASKKGFVTMDDIHAFNRAQRAARKPAAK